MLRELSKDRPTCKLLYITPEQLAKSAALLEKLTRLNRLGLLSLFVVDEVCARLCRAVLLVPCKQ